MQTSLAKILRRSRLSGILVGLILLWAASETVSAQQVNIQTTINPPNPETGERFLLNVQVSGSVTQMRQPSPKAPPGLDIQYRGHFNSSQVNFGLLNQREDYITLQFSVLAQKAGTYTIPAFDVEIDGRRHTAPATTFTVTEAVAKVWGELVLDRPAAFVGEMVPAHYYVYFDTSEVQPARRPERLEVNIPGFTVQDWRPEQPQMVSHNGRSVRRESYATAISPAKPGQFKIPPISSNWIVQSTSRPGGFPSLMDQDIFSMGPGAGMLSDFFGQREVTIESKEVDFEVKPLPEKGKPESFGGAIGTFSFLTKVTPTEAKTGDALTLVMKIKGTGNFGRVNAPLVKEDPATWKVYPPTSNFTAMDEMGLEGTKSFEQVLIPQRATTKLPDIAFSYFDPVSEKYITLKPEEVPLAIVGAPIQPAPPASSTVTAAKKEDDKKASPGAPKLEPLIAVFPGGPLDVRPVFTRPVFWAVQGVPLGLIVAFLLMTVRRYRQENPSAKQHMKALRVELAKAESDLDTPGTSVRSAYAAARRALGLHLHLRTHKEAPDYQLEQALRAQPDLSPELREDLDSFFARMAEVSYSGQGGDVPIDREEQRQLLEFTRRIAV